MEKYDFQPGEYMILQSEGEVYLDIADDTGTEEVTLTNMNLVVNTVKRISNGLFKKPTIVRGLKCFPLNQIQVRNEEAKIKISEDWEYIDLYFANSKERLWFTRGKKEIKLWVSAINEAVTGEPLEFGWGKKRKLSKAKSSISETFKDTANAFKEALNNTFDDGNFDEHVNNGTANSENIQSSQPEVVTKYCTTCGKPLAGHKGNMVYCGFCKNEQVL